MSEPTLTEAERLVLRYVDSTLRGADRLPPRAGTLRIAAGDWTTVEGYVERILAARQADADTGLRERVETEAWEEVAALLRDVTDTFEEHERASILSGATMVRLLAQSRRAALDAATPDHGGRP